MYCVSWGDACTIHTDYSVFCVPFVLMYCVVPRCRMHYSHWSYCYFMYCVVLRCRMHYSHWSYCYFMYCVSWGVACTIHTDHIVILCIVLSWDVTCTIHSHWSQCVLCAFNFFLLFVLRCRVHYSMYCVSWGVACTIHTDHSGFLKILF